MLAHTIITEYASRNIVRRYCLYPPFEYLRQLRLLSGSHRWNLKASKPMYPLMVGTVMLAFLDLGNNKP